MPFSVTKYSDAALLDALTEGSYDGRRSADPLSLSEARKKIEKKQQYKFLVGYFNETKPLTILSEKNYVDHDFLEDYAAYYSRCFQYFERFCRRLHFFACDFDADALRTALKAGASAQLIADLRKHYQGFIVVRPLPSSIIGRTCLVTYPSKVDVAREFPALRPYDVNLFGIGLQVRSVAFQEQDREVAACATAALWSLFQTTGIRFHHAIPSPIEITRAATAREDEDNATRSLPNDGLSLRQQASAVRSVGLEPLLIGMPKTMRQKWDYLRTLIYAYGGIGLPAIISSELSLVAERGARTVRGSTEVLGFHAVTAVGYRVEGGQATSIKPDGPLLKATRLKRIFVHDDQAGPFAKLSWERDEIRTSKPKDAAGRIVVADPRHILVPLYHKIRIPFQKVHDSIAEFDVIYRDIVGFLKNKEGTEKTASLDKRLEWDIRLQDVRSVKELYLHELKNANGSLENALSSMLTRNTPKYLWRCLAFVENKEMCEILYDATGLIQGKFFFDAFPRHDLLGTIAYVSRHPNAQSKIRTSPESLAILRAINAYRISGR